MLRRWPGSEESSEQPYPALKIGHHFQTKTGHGLRVELQHLILPALPLPINEVY